MIPRSRPAAAALVLLAALVLSACASRPKPMGPAPTQAPPPAPAEPGYTPRSSTPPVTEQRTGAIPGSAEDFVVRAGDRIYFDLDGVTIREDARGILDAQAGWLQRYPQVHVRIEGNCDDRGTEEYNFGLGARRAEAVKDYLVNHGVSVGRIETVSYGKAHPIAFGQSEEDYAKNRNAHTAITSGAR